jgi:phosphohistidine phosphatase
MEKQARRLVDLIEVQNDGWREVLSMRLYLVQHGEAAAKSEDPERPLTERGQDDVSRVAAFAQRAGVKVHQIRHSGKRRARETAAILAERLQPVDGIVASPGLAPKDDVRQVAELLGRESRSLMFVGHRPFMDRLAGLLVADDPDRAVVAFKMGGIVCLERDPISWTWAVRWLVTPDLIP